MRAVHFLIGALMVGAGALAGLWLPLGLMGSLALLALLRICWIEDNITSDLYGRDALPSGYLQTLEMRRLFMLRWFGVNLGAVSPDLSAHLLATALRAEAQLWAACLLGFVAMICAQHGPFAPSLDLTLAAALLYAALKRADRLAITLHHCDMGRPLPDEMLLPPMRRAQNRPR